MGVPAALGGSGPGRIGDQQVSAILPDRVGDILNHYGPLMLSSGDLYIPVGLRHRHGRNFTYRDYVIR